jgi:hypothetical protein
MTVENNALPGADDDALFAEMTALPVEAPAETQEPIAEIKEPVAEAKIAPEPQVQEQERDANRVPLKELLEERKARQALANELAELRGMVRATQPKPEPQHEPDIFEDSAAFVRNQMSPDMRRQQEMLLYNARLIAETRYGEDKVKEAQEAFDQLATSNGHHPADYAKVMQSPNPFAEVVKWHQTAKIVSEVGSDPVAYEAKVKAKLLSDPAFRQEAMTAWKQPLAPGQRIPGTPPINLPSLSRVGATALPTANEAAMSDDDLFQSITARRR